MYERFKRFLRLYSAGVGGASYILIFVLYLKSMREVTECNLGYCRTVSEAFQITISFEGGVYSFPILLIAGVFVVIGMGLNLQDAFLQGQNDE